MSSFQLPLVVTHAEAPSLQSRLPVHVSFSPTEDVLASLWETGYAELTDLRTRTRIGPGQGKVMDPLPLWKGAVGTGAHEYRQVAVLRSAEDAEYLVREKPRMRRMSSLCARLAADLSRIELRSACRKGTADSFLLTTMCGGNPQRARFWQVCLTSVPLVGLGAY